MRRTIRLSNVDKALSIAVVMLLLATIGGLVYTVVAGGADEQFTEFYVLGPGGNATYYPKEHTVGERAVFTLGIVNREGRKTTYGVEVTVGGQDEGRLGPIVLADGAQATQPVCFVPRRIGGNQTVEFLLFKNDEPAPGETLRLYIDVMEASPEGSVRSLRLLNNAK